LALNERQISKVSDMVSKNRSTRFEKEKGMYSREKDFKRDKLRILRTTGGVTIQFNLINVFSMWPK